MPAIAVSDPFSELAAGSTGGSPVRLPPPPPLPQRTHSLPVQSSSINRPPALFTGDPPPMANKATNASNNPDGSFQARSGSVDDGEPGIGWYDSELRKHKEAAIDATARANALERRLKAQEEDVRQARAAKEKDSAVLKELAILFRNSRVLRSEKMVLQYSERLKASGMEDLGSLLEDVVAREHEVAKMLTNATYLTALPLKGLIAPPGPPTPRQMQGLDRTGSIRQNPVPVVPMQRSASLPVQRIKIDPATADPARIPGDPDQYWWSAAGSQLSTTSVAPPPRAPEKYEYSSSDLPPSGGQIYKGHLAPASSRAIHKVAKRLGINK